MSLYTGSVWGGDGPTTVPVYFPYASGTPPTVFGPSKDFDDACLIDENLCISLHALDDPCQCESLEPADGCSGDIPSDDDPTVCEW